ncbi:hypothetical protein Hanom_Chr06g00574471 [Helianthus anomalus]
MKPLAMFPWSMLSSSLVKSSMVFFRVPLLIGPASVVATPTMVILGRNGFGFGFGCWSSSRHSLSPLHFCKKIK